MDFKEHSGSEATIPLKSKVYDALTPICFVIDANGMCKSMVD